MANDETLKKLKKTGLEAIERAVEQLAYFRAMNIAGGAMSEEEVDEFITEKGREYGERFAGMSKAGLAFFGISKMMESDPSGTVEKLKDIL